MTQLETNLSLIGKASIISLEEKNMLALAAEYAKNNEIIFNESCSRKPDYSLIDQLSERQKEIEHELD